MRRPSPVIFGRFFNYAKGSRFVQTAKFAYLSQFSRFTIALAIADPYTCPECSCYAKARERNVALVPSFLRFYYHPTETSEHAGLLPSLPLKESHRVFLPLCLAAQTSCSPSHHQQPACQAASLGAAA